MPHFMIFLLAIVQTGIFVENNIIKWQLRKCPNLWSAVKPLQKLKRRRNTYIINWDWRKNCFLSCCTLLQNTMQGLRMFVSPTGSIFRVWLRTAVVLAWPWLQNSRNLSQNSRLNDLLMLVQKSTKSVPKVWITWCSGLAAEVEKIRPRNLDLMLF